VAHSLTVRPEGRRCRWKPEVGADWPGEVAVIGPMQRKTKEMVWAGKKVLGLKLSKE
jgi:hypothetical protein